MSFTNSSSAFLAFRQNPRCPGPSGPAGPQGPVGPAGPVGPPGLSTGLEYYFYTEQTGTTYPNQPDRNNVGATGFSMQLVPGAGPTTPPGNGYYAAIPETYSGYFSIIDHTGFTGSNNGLLASFNLPLVGFNTIPAGSWNFSNQIYTYRTNSWPTNQTGSTIGMVPSLTYYTYGINGNSGPTGTVISSQSRSIDIGYTDTPYNYSLYLPNTTTIQFPSKDYINVKINLTGTFASNQFAEFWSEGGSVSQVITSFAPQSGPTGAVGPTGPGVIGEIGQVAFYGAGGVATGSNDVVFFNPHALTVNAPGSLNMRVNTTLNIDGVVSNTSGPINFINGGGILVNQNATVGGLVVNAPGAATFGGPVTINGQTNAQAIAATSLNVTGVSTLVGGLISNGTTFLTGQTDTQAIAATSINVTGRLNVAGFSQLAGAAVIGTQLNMGTLDSPRGTDGTVDIIMSGNKLVCEIAVSNALVVRIQPDPNIRDGSNGTIIPYVVKFGDLVANPYYSPNGEIAIDVAANQNGKRFAVLYI